MLIRTSLAYRGRTIPLAWKAMRPASAMVSFDTYQPVLDQMQALLPEGCQITLLADCGFLRERLITYAHHHHWHERIRMPSDTLVQVPHQAPRTVAQLRPALGQAQCSHMVTLFAPSISPVNLVVAQPADAPHDPWYIASDERTSSQALDDYGLRFDSDETFLDDKSGGFRVQTSEMQTPEAVERLFLILAIATLHFTSRRTPLGRYSLGSWPELSEHRLALA